MGVTQADGHNAASRQEAIDPEGSLPSDFSEKTNEEEDVEQAPQAETKAVDDPPDGGYGWVVVACCFLINASHNQAQNLGASCVGCTIISLQEELGLRNDITQIIMNRGLMWSVIAHTWGVNSSYGVFLAHYLSTNAFPGATPLEYAFVGGLSISMCQAVSPIATICTRKYGTRATMAVGILLETAALLGASWSTEIWQLFLAQGICFGWGMGFLFIASVGLIPQFFLRRRSFANSIGAAGSGIGGLVYSLATNAMIQSIGLGWAFRILAIISFVVNGVCAILVRDRNVAIGSVHEAFALRLLKRPEFLLLLGWGFFSLIGYVVLLFSLPNYATSIGLTPQQGSVIGALLNLGQGLGRPAVGYFSDAAGRMNIALLGTFITGFFCFVIWIFAKSYAVMIFFSLIVGIFAGTYWTTISVISAEVIGLQLLPSALSIVWISLIIPSTVAEPIGLRLKMQTGNIYLHAQIFTGCMYIAAAICLWFLRAWKIGELARVADGDAKKREAEIQDDDTVPREPELTRTRTVAASVRSTAKAAKGLWAWQRV